jgi:alpha-tubulin suppressor-like RCC1 family protein
MKQTLILLVALLPCSAANSQSITAGHYHSLAICTDSTVKAWGDGYFGNLGTGVAQIDTSLPVPVMNLTQVVATDAGWFTSAAIKSDSTLWTWGRNNYGQLGHGDLLDDSIPEQVPISPVAAVSCGYAHTLILKNGIVSACGLGLFGRLGDGITSNHNRTTPTQVTGLIVPITAIAAGDAHSLALAADSTVYAWGNGVNGELGDGASMTSATPVHITTLTGVIAIAAGNGSSFALKADGTVWAWGANTYYQLGDSTFNFTQPSPVRVAVIDNIVKISRVRAQHAFAIKSDGTVWGWGDNPYGELGIGTWGAENYPRQVTTMSGVQEAEAGAYFSLWATNDTVWSAGKNNAGQLGNGTNIDSAAVGAMHNICTLLTQLSVSVSSTNVTCNGSIDGSATAIASGGTAPYTYSWSTGATTATILGAQAGTYTVTVSDADGTTIIETVTITEPPALTAVGSTVQNVFCFGGNSGIATVTAGGGTPGYFYQWSPSGGTNQTATGLAANIYSVTVTDVNGCTVMATAFITQPSALTANGSNVTNVSCFGGNNGSVSVNSNGGSPPYNYLWSPSGQTWQTATSLAMGTYTVTVTDANGCTVTATASVSQPSALNVSLTNINNASCSTCSDGSASVSASGGVPGYTYSWTPSGGNSATASNLLPGNYTACVSDANGCTQCMYIPVNSPSAITDNAFAPFSIYPNPAHAGFTVSFGEFKTDNAELTMLDVAGRVVHHELICATSEIRNSFSPGIYYVRIKAGTNVFTVKLVIE